MSHKTDYVIVKDRFPRISEVLNDCADIYCVSSKMNEPLSSILKKICGKIREVESAVTEGGCCYTFENSDTVTFSVSEDNVVSAEAIIDGDGTVTSVSLSDITNFALATGNPVTDSGTLGYSLIAQPANTVFAGPASGSSSVPTFRVLEVDDIPALPYVTDANEGLSVTGGIAQLGQLVGAAGNPAQFTGGLGVDREIPMGDSYLHFNNKGSILGFGTTNPSSITIKPINDPELIFRSKHGGSIKNVIQDPAVDTFPALVWYTEAVPTVEVLQVFNGIHWTASDKHYDVADMHGSILGAAFQSNGSSALMWIGRDGMTSLGQSGARKTSFGYATLASANAYAFVHIAPSTTSIAHLFLDAGVAPSGGSLQNGQIWHQTDNHIYARLAGTTYQIDRQFTGITANNGLTASSSINTQLGGTLTQNTTISAGAFFLLIDTATSGAIPLRVTSTDNNAIQATTNSANAVAGIATSGVGINGGSQDSYGGYFQSTNGTAIIGQVLPSSTNTVVTVLELDRVTTGTAAAGMGGSIDFKAYTNTSADRLMNQIISEWTTATDASRTSQFSITGVDNAVTTDLLTLSGSGAAQLNQYGSGTFTGTPTGTLQVDVTGDIIESPATLAERTPASAADTGIEGDIVWDSNFIYICVAANTWKRAAISTW